MSVGAEVKLTPRRYLLNVWEYGELGKQTGVKVASQLFFKSLEKCISLFVGLHQKAYKTSAAFDTPKGLVARRQSCRLQRDRLSHANLGLAPSL
jgi:hypothetical protein